MPRTPRCKCINCERIFDSNEVREVGDGLLRLFLAVRLSKRIYRDDAICQKCRCQFLNWKKRWKVILINLIVLIDGMQSRSTMMITA